MDRQVRALNDGRDYQVDLLAKGAFGWAQRWEDAITWALFASKRYERRHRVFWSSGGNAWMIRRAHATAEELAGVRGT